jgi:hypothetical protein
MKPLSDLAFKYCEVELREDLKDISANYKLKPVHPNDEEMVPSGPSVVWVVEKEYPDKDDVEIVGCIGLDKSLLTSSSDQVDNCNRFCRLHN